MELRHLRYFVAVAEERHFGRAAARLHVVQPTLSMQIRALEHELGGLLFLRTSRRVELTEAGELFLVEARRTLSQADWAKTTAQRSLNGETGSVRVGFAGVAALIGTVGKDLEAFRERRPRVRIELHEMVPRLQGEAIAAGELDLGYTPDYVGPEDSGLRTDRIGSAPLVVALSDRHRLAGEDTLALHELLDEPFIDYSPDDDDSKALGQIRGRNDGRPRIVHRASTTLSVLALAAAGFGVALVPEQSRHVEIPGVVYRALRDREVSVDLLVISRRDETNAAARALLSIARGGRAG